MLIVLSPAKTLDYETPPTVAHHTLPEFLDDSRQLVESLRELDPPALAGLMSISDKLAALNVARFAQWSLPFEAGPARQAALAFAGDVYDGLDAKTLDPASLDWAQQHLRILSGLYGLLRPLDLMLPYRLEMGTRLANSRGRDLYAFWGGRLAAALSDTLDGHRHPVLVNLASDEYFKALPARELRHPVVQPVFQERRGNAWKIISFSAKRARGAMTRFAIDRRIDDPKGLQAFDRDGYRFDAAASDERRWFFRREQP
ncbi:MAG: peroxide stress protein YaaA [Burkholderiaceae bacterium]